MENLANALMQCKPFKNRQQHLSESLDFLSFNYPSLYTQFVREIKKREIESNDIKKMSKWNNTSNSYIKLHEALIMVKSHNIIAKEEYLENIKQMLGHTIEYETNIEEALKICYLIERYPNLTTIYEQSIHLIQQVKKLHEKKRYTHKITDYVITGNLKPTLIDHFEPNQYVQQVKQYQHFPIYPTILQQQIHPFYNLEYFEYSHFGMVTSVNKPPIVNSSQVLSNITIVSQDMGPVVLKWLYYLKLHKYYWFFQELSYLEIEFIDEVNIEGFIAKVNRDYITKGAQKKICISTKLLKNRSLKFKHLLLALDLEVTDGELCEFISYMRDILHYPIPNKNCIVGDQLQQDIIIIMDKLLKQLLEKLHSTTVLVGYSLLGTSINKYLECTLLIAENQIFMKYQVDNVNSFAETLKHKVNQMPSNFN